MSTTLNKLEYLDGTKGQIKTALNQFGSGIKNDDTFRSYVDKIKDIYNNWEKVTSEGKEVILTGTKKAKMGIVTKGNSEQDGEPSPSNEVPIKNVTGNNNVVVNSKNLANIYLENKYMPYQSGVPTTLNGFNTYIVMVEPDADYSMGYDSNETDRTAISNVCFLDSSLNYISGVGFSSGSLIHTINNKKCKYITVACSSSQTKLQIEPGSSVTPYVPYQNQTLPFNLGTKKMMLGDYPADDGIHHVRKQIVFDGSNDENWTSHGNAGIANKRFIIEISDMKKGTSDNQYLVLCTHFKQGSYSQTDNFIFVIGGYNEIWVGSTQLENLDMAGFRTWLSNNPITVEYELADSTLSSNIEAYTSEQQTQWNNIKKATSYEGTTIITSTYDSSNAQMILSTSALKGGTVNE